MKDNNKNDTSYRTIGEAAKEIGLIDKKTGLLQTHTIRYWETQFRQIKPTIKAGGRRYYSARDIKVINYIKFLLKEKGLTINGVKKILNDNKSQTIDDYVNLGLYNQNSNSTKIIKDKIKTISKIIKDIKKLKNG